MAQSNMPALLLPNAIHPPSSCPMIVPSIVVSAVGDAVMLAAHGRMEEQWLQT